MIKIVYNFKIQYVLNVVIVILLTMEYVKKFKINVIYTTIKVNVTNVIQVIILVEVFA
jgi:hypothetical protein